ncbi:MAG TPA: hypothetical protein VJM11_16380 [Nevskiaceae bacterium]|nr:hypothetical protein [Nevskiaceae bacterium]
MIIWRAANWPRPVSSLFRVVRAAQDLEAFAIGAAAEVVEAGALHRRLLEGIRHEAPAVIADQARDAVRGADQRTMSAGIAPRPFAHRGIHAGLRGARGKRVWPSW